MKFSPFLKTGLILLFFASIFIGCSSDDNASEPVVRVNGTALLKMMMIFSEISMETLQVQVAASPEVLPGKIT
ncbi:hypothetical protein [Christiangramia sabulilitoris]|uniref:hypothetical protein n=1 Tax=Christiangramia sabulilitoris TaxID=2583991 RepID=UPI001FB7F53E|nr:hypothetical protein [Christiangramia sabulilitoris]